ncbi:CGNR zinc finger domain-containing protein [Paenibacillus yanchengensis]|uniref:CGNR zinc finger domain-containing protein n=1 Tax=Paenibacillus yanchengensis TaxID=2035833 RepID=A0ABW4YEU2_9BACL
MRKTTRFPLISGNLSIDLVNTEVVRRGQRIDLLTTEDEVWDWLQTVQQQLSFWELKKEECAEHLFLIKKKLILMRKILRKHFEHTADGLEINSTFLAYLEANIELAPLTFKFINQQLVTIPLGKVEEMIASLIAYDALSLLANGKLSHLKRCANEDCVLLFMDEHGRRKWCSMKICGNRNKVATYQQRQSDEQ